MADIEFYTQFGKTRPMGSKEVSTKPSLTEPDNALSIPDIIARFTRGQGYGVPVHDWSGGSAPEEGEEIPQDDTLEKVLGIEVPAAPAAPAEPAAPADPAAPVEPAAPAAPAVPTPPPAGA